MSGVNCTRRNSTPTARRTRRHQRLGDTGHAFEQQVPADARCREHDVDDVVLADDDLADLAHDSVSQLVHRSVLSSVTRVATAPEREHFVIVDRRLPQCHDLGFGQTQAPRPRRSRRRDPRRAARPRADLDPVAAHSPSGASARARSWVRSSVSAIASTYRDRAGGSSRSGRSGGPRRRARDHANRIAASPSSDEPGLPAVGIAPRPLRCP